YIGNNNLFKSDMRFLLFSNSQCSIGDNNKFYSERTEFRCHSCTNTVIKSFTLWSQEIQVLNGDGHSIFDLVTKRKTNDYYVLPTEKKTIFVDNGCWIGKRAMLLTGTHLNEGSIVGANSLVKKKFPNNVIIAGCPGKVIRRNICWTFKNDTTNISDCEPYTKLTQDENEE
ncbi:MAG: hypothetical protein LUD27_06735, partial [Clostridia bacterium]|nr:hypothetical protein [Clostridia bacterium]